MDKIKELEQKIITLEAQLSQFKKVYRQEISEIHQAIDLLRQKVGI